MVTFSDDLHPKYKKRIRFKYPPRAFQYLNYFNIITILPVIRFIPLDFTFDTVDELYQFLYNKGIVFDEVGIRYIDTQKEGEATVVDTSKIFDVEESITKYLLRYKYYSVNEVAEMLSFSRPTVYKLIKEKTIKTVRIDGQFRINHADLMKFINNESQE